MQQGRDHQGLLSNFSHNTYFFIFVDKIFRVLLRDNDFLGPSEQRLSQLKFLLTDQAHGVSITTVKKAFKFFGLSKCCTQYCSDLHRLM